MAPSQNGSDTKASINSYITLCSSSGTKQEEALKWAEDLSAKWDSLPKKERLRNLAEQMGVTDMTVSRWKTNKIQPSMAQFVEIARLLQVDIKDLIEYDS